MFLCAKNMPSVALTQIASLRNVSLYNIAGRGGMVGALAVGMDEGACTAVGLPTLLAATRKVNGYNVTVSGTTAP